VFGELGAEVTSIGIQPDGFNINEGVGSTDTAALSALVRERGVDFGIAFDGDGDRVLFVDSDGELVDGDELIYMIAMHRLSSGYQDAGVVGTLMSNLGLELALKAEGLEFARAQVGDRYVKERMEAEGWFLGGESSGHIICSDVTTTGDGIVAALQVLVALKDSGKTLAEFRSGMKKYPQRMINVPVAGKVNLEEYPAVAAAVAKVEGQLGERGRVLLRPSGTEPKVRVMVEGDNAAEVETLCAGLAVEVERELG
jgi:phosphoglucosamine mutase